MGSRGLRRVRGGEVAGMRRGPVLYFTWCGHQACLEQEEFVSAPSLKKFHSFQLPGTLSSLVLGDTLQLHSLGCRWWSVKSQGFYFHGLQSDKLSTSLGGVCGLSPAASPSGCFDGSSRRGLPPRFP